MNNIVLIGFMGSGKSSIGRILSVRSKRYFLDTDALIEAHEARSISEIFALKGEEAFRGAERAIASWLETSVSNAAIATGGGMPTVCDNLRAIGFTVYLKCDFATIAKRLESDAERGKRPLASSLAALSERFSSRAPIYEAAADFTIDATLPLDQISDAILRRLPPDTRQNN